MIPTNPVTLTNSVTISVFNAEGLLVGERVSAGSLLAVRGALDEPAQLRLEKRLARQQPRGHFFEVTEETMAELITDGFINPQPEGTSP